MTENPLKTDISNAMKDAMRARDKVRLGALRLILAEIKRVEVDERIDVEDARVLSILDKMSKQRRDSIKQFHTAGRDDLVAQEQTELDIISEFMPAALGDDEITALIAQAIEQSKAESVRDMGKVMALIKPQIQGRADMAAVSKQVKAALG